MNEEINRIRWKCRRGMREIDLLLREFSITKLEALNEDESFLNLTDVEKQEKTDAINEKYENSSRINPFRTSHVEDFNFWYFYC